jgi:diadenosine tetraphosphate (Ap4A) HIT family hydrolase
MLHETDRFVVMADISPLVPGHVMIVPKAHILCYGAVEAAAWDEFAGIVNATRAIIREHYGPSVILEHGTCSVDDVADHVSHAHLHIVPADIDIRINKVGQSAMFPSGGTALIHLCRSDYLSAQPLRDAYIHS